LSPLPFSASGSAFGTSRFTFDTAVTRVVSGSSTKSSAMSVMRYAGGRYSESLMTRGSAVFMFALSRWAVRV
jgi:hypothetical protein